ncbi:MAG: hypothetical protein F4Y86_08720 [Gammaproteobacteria bacterium]|nr:hypothetical protein [Gammaproteobacteria bacterium]
MFKLPSLPTPSSDVHELADFIELLAWMKGMASLREVAAYLGQTDDNDPNVGIEDSQNQIADRLDEVMHEIEARSEACRVGYPFVQDPTGTVLRSDAVKLSDVPGRVYCYLLLSTRLNMERDRILADIDGTHLLEQLAKVVLRGYLGDRACSLVFGTSKQGTFDQRINNLCSALAEGVAYTSRTGRVRRSGDGKLDVVAWKPFADGLPGKVILFVQCKTGTSWRNDVAQLQPDAFCDKWIQQPLGITPVRTFVISEAEERVRFPETVLDAGLLFDRCRIIDFCPDLNADLAKRLHIWTSAAFAVARAALDPTTPQNGVLQPTP